MSNLKTEQSRSLTVVGATRNEARNVPLVIAELAAARDILLTLGISVHLVVVDDASTDDTVAALTAEARLRSLSLEVVDGPLAGLSQAIATGLRAALLTAPDAIAVLDFDGQHDATELPEMVRVFFSAEPRLDCVFGSRFLDRSTFVGVTPIRRSLSHMARAALRLATRIRLPSDPTTSFRVSSPEIVETFLHDVPTDDLGGYEFFFWFAVFTAARGTFADVPIRFRPRLAGSSKLRTPEVVAAALTLREVGGRAREWRRLRLPDGGFPAYPTEYLDSISEMAMYNEWLVGSFSPFVHGRVLELGAGTGTVTTRMAALTAVAHITAVEPDLQRFNALRAAISAGVTDADRVLPVLGTVESVDGEYDSILYCNSAEHIRDLLADLKMAMTRCAPGGSLIVFGPAHEALYGELDRLSGHWRRFTKAGLEREIRAAGFAPFHSEYLDPVGAFAYFAGGRLGGVSSLSPKLLWVFENMLLPLSRAITPLTRNVFGKNVLVVARPKPASSE